MVRAADPRPQVVVIDLDPNTDFEVETRDDFGELVTTLRADGIDAAVDRASFTQTG